MAGSLVPDSLLCGDWCLGVWSLVDTRFVETRFVAIRLVAIRLVDTCPGRPAFVHDARWLSSEYTSVYTITLDSRRHFRPDGTKLF